MTVLASEDFEGLANAATISTGNTSFDQVTGTSLDATIAAIVGTGAMDLNPASSTHTARWTAAVSGRTSLYSRAYWRVGALPGNDLWIMGVGNAADSRVGVVVLMPTGAIKLLDGGNAGGADVSVLTLGVGDTIRIEHHVDITAGTMEARLFVGDNLEGGVPDEVLTAAIVLSDLADWRVGRILSRGTNVIVDALAIGDAWIGPAVGQPFGTLVDTFDSDSGLWPGKYGGSTVSGGQAVVDCDVSQFSGFKSAAAYYLAGSQVGGQFFPPAANGGSSAYMAIFATTTTPGTDAGFNIDAGFMGLLLREGFSDPAAEFVAYSSVDHAWLRLREDADTLFWEASPDGATWSQLRSETSPAWVSDPDLAFLVDSKRTDGTDNTGAFDNVNVFGDGADPAEGTAATSLALSVSATGSRPSAGTATTGLLLATAATGSRPSAGVAAAGLALAVSATGSRDSAGSASTGLRLVAAGSGSRPSSGSASTNLLLRVSGGVVAVLTPGVLTAAADDPVLTAGAVRPTLTASGRP